MLILRKSREYVGIKENENKMVWFIYHTTNT